MMSKIVSRRSNATIWKVQWRRKSRCVSLRTQSKLVLMMHLQELGKLLGECVARDALLSAALAIYHIPNIGYRNYIYRTS